MDNSSSMTSVSAESTASLIVSAEGEMKNTSLSVVAISGAEGGSRWQKESGSPNSRRRRKGRKSGLKGAALTVLAAGTGGVKDSVAEE